MIYIDDSEPEGVLEAAFPSRDVAIKRNTDAHELYDILGEVGRGKFGTVYKCQDKTSGLKLAAKFVPIPKREDKRNVEREVEIMNSLQHHLIIQLYAAYEYQKMMCVVLELVEGGELFDRVVEDEFILTERVCVVFIRQVCEAMAFIHRNNILHLDLKPENILCLTQEGNRIKIIDFGLARKFDPDKRLQILFGTPEFVAPEVVNFDCISYGTDMWSVGVICYVLISGLSPFMGETDIETMANVTIAKYDFEDESFNNVSQECLDFIAKLLVKDLSTRMTAAQCLEHKWLQQRPKPPPIVSLKPVNVPPPKLKSSTPTPEPEPAPTPVELNNNKFEEAPKVDKKKTSNDKKKKTEPEPELLNNIENTKSSSKANMEKVLEHTKELDTTKDNLKNFIERWEEHPNSPYVFDVEGNVIAPLSESPYKKPHGADSISSSRVCSPSPCESIGTLTDDEDVFIADDTNSDSPKSLATPINESREKLFPLVSSISNGSTSNATTPTPQYAPQHLFNERFDEFSGTTKTAQQQRSLKSYLHTFDRRNSDTNYLTGRRSSGERINLADEIRKLSDHLLMLAEINTKLGDEAKTEESTTKQSDANNNSNASNESTQTVESTTTKDDHKATTMKTIRSSATSSSANKLIASASTSTKSDTSYNDGSTKVSSLSVRLQKSIEETPKLTNGTTRKSWTSTTTTTTTSRKSTGSTGMSTSKSPASTISLKPIATNISNAANASTSSTSTSTSTSTSETANSRRAKFRINQMSRDVPIGLPNTHQTVNLEEAANTTKDCLLHLLEKYNETKCRNPLSRHQSISVDWHMSDNLEYRSMSSINAFFRRHNNTGGRNVKQLQAQLEEKATGK